MWVVYLRGTTNCITPRQRISSMAEPFIHKNLADKRKGVTYAQLAERLEAMGIPETERNLNNKISRGGFTAAFLLQCLEAIEAKELRIV